MGYYFGIGLRGKGTAYVESLLSYWARLSSAHGLTIYQLASHMSAWATKQGLGFPAHLLNGRVLSMCGYGPDVGKMVELIETATGIHGLSAATLAALRPVLSPSGTGATRRSKAWCPRCYEEDLADYGECYDRLLWALAPIDRCPIHRLRLETACPNCAADQRFPRPNGDLASCHDCGACLIGAPSQWKVTLEPTLGEKELGEMLSYMATAEGPAFVENAFEIYEVAAQIRRPRLLLGDRRRSKRPQKPSVPKPLLKTLLKVVVADGADLVTLLTDPIGAVSHAQMLDGFGINFEVVRRARRPRQVFARTSAILEETALDPNRPSLGSACRRAGVSTGYARYQFAGLSKRITTRWEAGRRAMWDRRAREAISVLLNAEWDRYQKGEHRSQDALVEALVGQSSCSTRVARLLVAARAHGRRGILASESSVPGAVPLATEEGLIDRQEVARMTGRGLISTTTMLCKQVREGKLFQVARRGKRFPAFQFTENGRPRPVIAAMLNSVRPGDEVRFYKWMLASHKVLHRLRPVDILDDARSALLPDLARIEFE